MSIESYINPPGHIQHTEKRPDLPEWLIEEIDKIVERTEKKLKDKESRSNTLDRAMY